MWSSGSEEGELAIPWEEGHRLAASCAIDMITEMRKAYNKFAANDPYELGKVMSLEPSAKETETEVAAMTQLFSLILNRRGLLKIDPS